MLTGSKPIMKIMKIKFSFFYTLKFLKKTSELSCLMYLKFYNFFMLQKQW